MLVEIPGALDGDCLRYRSETVPPHELLALKAHLDATLAEMKKAQKAPARHPSGQVVRLHPLAEPDANPND